MTAKELALKLEAKRTELKSVLDGFKKDGKISVPADKFPDIQARNDELAELNSSYMAQKQVEDLDRENEEALKEYGKVERPPVASTKAVKSVGEQVIESGAVKAARSGAQGAVMLDVDPVDYIKTAFLESAGWAPESPRSGIVALSPQRALRLLDVLPITRTTNSSYKFMQETSLVNSAAEKAEGANNFGESELEYTEKTVDMRRIGHTLPVSDEILEDEPSIQALLNSRLGYMVNRRFEGQMIGGDGVAPNILGFLNAAGINSQALGADTIMDCVHKGITLCRVNGEVEPNSLLLHPSDWEQIILAKDGNNQYLHHGPAISGPLTLWGLQVITTTGMPSGTGAVVDMSSETLHGVVRRGLEILIGLNGNDLKQGNKTCRADMRGALALYKPAGITKLTGI